MSLECMVASTHLMCNQWLDFKALERRHPSSSRAPSWNVSRLRSKRKSAHQQSSYIRSEQSLPGVAPTPGTLPELPKSSNQEPDGDSWGSVAILDEQHEPALGDVRGNVDQQSGTRKMISMVFPRWAASLILYISVSAGCDGGALC